jgi:tryptophan 2,3-dioxygenase
MLFIITHQVYELWFKLIIHELNSVIDVFDDPVVEDRTMGLVIHRLSRIKAIQRLLINQIDVIETMTPLDFLEFRDLLVPASGFQSIQFKTIEIKLGLKREHRILADREFFESRLNDADRRILAELEKKPGLFELTDRWLQRMPFLKFGDFQFWPEYAEHVEKMLASDEQIIRNNRALTERERTFQLGGVGQTRELFRSILDEAKYDELRRAGEFRLTHQGFLAALFIHLYRDEPVLFLPFQFLTLLVEIDERFTSWRQRHALMVQRMLGTKIGTGGSSGHDYLLHTTRQNRIFLDLFKLSTFLLPRNELPPLPVDLRKAMGFFLSGER